MFEQVSIRKFLRMSILSTTPNINKPINGLLAALPNVDYQSLVPHLELVKLPQHKIIYRVGDRYKYAYFPSDSVISTVATMANGSTIEIGAIGHEGMIGLPIIFDTEYANSTAIVKIAGGSYQIAAERLKEELNRQGAFKTLMMRYVQARIAELGQTSACNRHHRLEQRFARWLLTTRDNVQKNEFQATHEFISQMLGVRRSGVSEIAGQFKERGIISYRRGFMHINSKEKLEACACECYWSIAHEFSRLLDSGSP